jgi:hypothetical protein
MTATLLDNSGDVHLLILKVLQRHHEIVVLPPPGIKMSALAEGRQVNSRQNA